MRIGKSTMQINYTMRPIYFKCFMQIDEAMMASIFRSIRVDATKNMTNIIIDLNPDFQTWIDSLES